MRRAVLTWMYVAGMLLLAACSRPSAPVAARPAAADAIAPGPPESIVKQELKEIQATVEAVDAATRAVTLQGTDGEVTLIAGPEVRNFDQIKVGDRLAAKYYVTVTAQRGTDGPGEANGSAMKAQSAASTHAPPAGAPPAGGTARTTTITVRIESVDTAAETVSFIRPDGTHRTVAAQTPEMREFLKTLTPGDDVDVTYTEAVAVDMHSMP
jgi:hypothetical protein